MLSSFSNLKVLRFVITLGTGTFGSSNNNQITIEGFRSVANVTKAGWKQQGSLEAQIYGMAQSDMDAATVLQWRPGYLIETNKIDVYAIDGEQQTLVFSGNIVNSWGNYTAAPDVFFQIQAQTAYHNALTPVAPRSYNGAADVATVAGQIANSMGLSFENNGVNTSFSDVYLANTDLMQMKKLAELANIDFYIDDSTLAICPKGSPRNALIPEISSTSGLQTYPAFDGQGVTFVCLFNPAIVFGGALKLVSSIKHANEQWLVQSVSHRLEGNRPGGSWASQVRGIPYANGVSLAQ